jgi:hypothetical protein
MPEDYIGNATKSVVTIAAVGPIILALYNRHLILIQRLRGLNREMISEYSKPSRHSHHIIKMIKQQIEKVNRASIWLNVSIVLLLIHINLQVICTILFGIKIYQVQEAAHWFFVTGMIFMWFGITTAIAEVSVSLKPVLHEEDFIQREISEVEIGIMNSGVG